MNTEEVNKDQLEENLSSKTQAEYGTEKQRPKCISLYRARVSTVRVFSRNHTKSLSDIMLSGLLVDFSWVKWGMGFGFGYGMVWLAGQIGGFMGSRGWRSRAGTH